MASFDYRNNCLTTLYNIYGDKIDCNAGGQDQETPLMIATADNNIAFITTLYNTYGDKVDPNLVDKDGFTALEMALNRDYFDSAKKILQLFGHKISTNLDKIFFNAVSDCNCDLLYLVNKYCHDNIDWNSDFLLENNIIFDTLLKSVAGNNILLIETINEYWSNNPDVNKDCNCSTELISIAQSNIYLVEDIYKEEDGKRTGNSILKYLVKDNSHLIIKLLRYWGNKLDLGVRNCDGDTVLMYLVKHNNIYLIKKLQKFRGNQLFDQSKNVLNMATNCQCLKVLLDCLLDY